MMLRTEIALVPLGGTSLRSGRIEILPPTTRGSYGRLRYRFSGALADAELSVRLLVHPFDATGTNVPLIFATATVRTTDTGDGSTEVDVRSEDVPASVRGAEHGLRWEVSHGGAVLYRTACCSVRLPDPKTGGFHRRQSGADDLTITPPSNP